MRFLLIFIDSLRFDATSFTNHLSFEYRNKNLLKTPNLDRFLSKAVVFKRAYSVSTYTPPVEVSVLSGLYPHSHGHIGFLDEGNREAITYALGKLKSKGFKIGILGHSPGTSKYFGDIADVMVEDTFTLLDEVCNFIREISEENRFLALVRFIDIHDPYGYFPSLESNHPVNFNFLSRAAKLSSIGFSNGFRLNPECLFNYFFSDREARARLYFKGVSLFDKHVFGKLWETIQSCGLDENGYVFVFSDHGDGGEGFCHATFPHEDVIRILLAVKGPGLRPRTEDRLVSVVDIMATVMEMVGLNAKSMDGVPLFSQNPPADRVVLGASADIGSWHLYFAEGKTEIPNELHYTYAVRLPLKAVFDVKANSCMVTNVITDPLGRRSVEGGLAEFLKAQAKNAALALEGKTPYQEGTAKVLERLAEMGYL